VPLVFLRSRPQQSVCLSGFYMMFFPTCRRRIARFTLALVLIALPLSAQAAETWLSQAQGLFEADEYERTIKVVKPHSKDEDMDANLFLMFSNLQMYQYTRAKYYQTRYRGIREWVEAKATLNSLPRILYFGEQNDKPEVVKTARRVAGQVIAATYRIEDVPNLVSFASSHDPGMQKLAYKAVRRILKNPRTVVKKGGNMRAKDIKIMQDPKLIAALVNGMDISDAAAALVLIEEPALEELGLSANPKALKLEGKIVSAISKREKKYPNSVWHSATGKTR